MPWLPIVFVIIIVLMTIILGYFLIRSFLRGYTYDVPSKTQSKRALFSGICVTLLAVSILGVSG
jgi:predicted ABC-type sugar transport system permease subunit